ETKHPFEVITDYKNLQCLRDAKRLNSRQARWSLFFTRFNFTLTYRPGHKDTKADTLSRIDSPDPPTKQLEPVLPPAGICVLTVMTIKTVGASICHGPSTPRILSTKNPLVSHHSSAHSVSIHLYSHGRGNCHLPPLSALQEAESPLCWSIPHHKVDK
ncbi:hypothetical protein M9458_056796, partial [Cirrhinus mrigala]